MLTMDPGTPPATARFTLAYMAVALATLSTVLLSSGTQPRDVAAGPSTAALAPLVAAHAIVAGLLLLASRRSEAPWPAATAWLPLLAIPLLYAELPWLMQAVGTPYGDATVQHWELALWGGHPSRTLAGRLPAWWLSELLHLAYLSYYAVIYLPLAWLWSRTRLDAAVSHRSGVLAAHAFDEASLAVMATFALCFTVFVLFPVQGPRYLWQPDAVPGGPVRAMVLGILERGSSRGAAFPSSHMAVATVQALMAFRWRIPGRVLVAMLTLGLGVGAVYGGFHYAVDMVAGAVVGVLVFATVTAWAARRQRPMSAPTSALPPSRT